MTDVAGVEVVVGDLVAFVTPYYHGLRIAKVVKLTPCGVTVEQPKERYNKTLNRSADQIAKVVKA